MKNITFAKNCIENNELRVVGFQEAIHNMRFEYFSKDDAEFFANNYFTIKGDADRTAIRSVILIALVLQCLQYELKDFFLTVFKKERHLDTRLTAIRGYAAYATEAEVIPIMDKFTQILNKGGRLLALRTEYELLRSKFGLPYLIRKYGYSCFIEAAEVLDKMYDSLPKELKGYFTYDENGVLVKLMSDKKMKRKFEAWLERHNPCSPTQ